MIVLRQITLVLAMLTLVVTAQAFALARGAAPVAGQMVLCIGTGSVTVNIDADGQPVGAPHICPDAALTLLGHDVVVWMPARAVEIRRAEYAVGHVSVTRLASAPAYLSRAPPVLL
ncbi:hypothetical protein [Pseudosulfitobacter sp. DSM 107133]|jgi:hypothetical protein|uniref:hypothetical protein n=1 Tax=Pseudosulfitobacter sp. DSM 107133 TaxID=2883100 RepID=UPI000DF42F11|nr:hypothetical protein [Pseudosulfitobacter sp. DSM 107133]UOA26140.1 hypothetical protein DSM107133_00831 [Pseudosulfitobacter sp. DSM 107133]